MAETPARGGGPDRWRTEAEARVASLAKPPGALGNLGCNAVIMALLMLKLPPEDDRGMCMAVL